MTGQLTLQTAMPDLRLVELLPEDAAAYYTLVDRNRAHLTQHGNYLDLGEATPESVLEDLMDPENRNARFGIWVGEQFIGRVDLNPRTVKDFVLGYWLGGEYTGKGYATAACAANSGTGQRPNTIVEGADHAAPRSRLPVPEPASPPCLHLLVIPILRIF
jgi:RimJ/RimL family protein N-acetyltransferase